MDKEQLRTRSIEESRSAIKAARMIGSRITRRSAMLMQAGRSKIEAAVSPSAEEIRRNRLQKIAGGSLIAGAISASAVAAARFMNRRSTETGAEPVPGQAYGGGGSPARTTEAAASVFSYMGSPVMTETDTEPPEPAA